MQHFYTSLFLNFPIGIEDDALYNFFKKAGIATSYYCPFSSDFLMYSLSALADEGFTFSFLAWMMA